VQTSIAPDGQPNLVEEGETIINNQNEGYVFSDRIVANEEILKSHLLPDKFAGKTYAEISKELDRIIEEHKTDEISKRTFDEMIKRLQEAQEDQKFQEKQAEVEKFLNGLSDDEKEALTETMVEEAEAEQQAVQEQAAAEQ
jgi:predicted transcriptional regulator